MQPHFFIVYDGIENSVFASQAVHPLIAQLEQNPTLHAHIISFERTPHQVTPYFHPRLTIHIAHKVSFFGVLSLAYAARQLRPLLSAHTAYTLTARGPFAGYIALKAQTTGCTQLTIQARGLAAEEYRYTHLQKNTPWLLKLFHRLRAAQYESLEANIFGPRRTNRLVTIQAVSLALRDYLVTNFAADETRITLAQHDCPTPLRREDKIRWRATRRTELGIAPDALVYCYSGSAKSWQCPQTVISFFKDRYTLNSHAVLLIMTTDLPHFAALLKNQNLAPHSYRLICVKPDEVCEYLSASDIGLLFREPHPLNWVSRPTKALEYQAAGLYIEHNNTVAMLSQNT